MIPKCKGEGCRVRNRCARHTKPMGPYLLWEYQVIPPHDIKKRKHGCDERLNKRDWRSLARHE